MFLHDFFDTKKSAVKEGETTLTKTGRVHRSTDAYGGTPREPDSLGNKLDKAGTNSIERALDIKWDRKKEWQGGVEVDTSEGIAGELIGGTIGGVAGTLGGAAVGGPMGALVGGAAGGTAGQMAGRELTKEEGRERIYSNGDRVKLNSTYSDYRNPNEIFTVSQCDQERKRCWIGDKSGSGWYATFDQLIPARSRAKEDDTKLNKNIDNGHLRMLVHRAMKARQAGKSLTSVMRADEIKTLLMAKGTGQLKDLFAEDSWHGEGEAWHGGGNEPMDAWHGQEGVTEEQLDEFLPALAAGAGALARGAAMAGGAALKGAQAAGNAVVKGAQAAGNAVVKGVQAVTPPGIGKVPGQVVKGFEVLDALVPGGIFDANGNIKSPQILSKFLTPQQIQQVQQQPVQQQSPSQQVAQNQQQGVAEQLSDASPVTGAITRRILKQRLDLLKQYGPELVGAAIDNVADYVGDVDEIGSSDVNAWVAQVERMLRDNPPEAFAEASKTRNPTRDFLRNNPVSSDQMAKPVKQMSVPELAAVSDEALDKAYGYGRSTPTNTFGWQANLASASYAKQKIDKGVTDIEAISDAIHKGWNVTARAFVQNPDQFDDRKNETLKLQKKSPDKSPEEIAQEVNALIEKKRAQRAELMKQNYSQLPEDEKEKDRVVARALLQAVRGQLGVAEGHFSDQDDKVAKHNAAVAKLPNGHAHRSNHPDLLKKAPKGYFFNISHKLVPDKKGMAEGVTEGTNYWTKLQDARNKKINSLVNELKESIM